MAVSLRTRLEQQLNCKLAASTIFDFPSVEQLTNYLLSLLFEDPQSAAPLDSKSDEKSITSVNTPESQNELSDSEIAALIDGELSSLTNKKDGQ
jgi:hypothetical protein